MKNQGAAGYDVTGDKNDGVLIRRIAIPECFYRAQVALFCVIYLHQQGETWSIKIGQGYICLLILISLSAS